MAWIQWLEFCIKAPFGRLMSKSVSFLQYKGKTSKDNLWGIILKYWHQSSPLLWKSALDSNLLDFYEELIKGYTRSSWKLPHCGRICKGVKRSTYLTWKCRCFSLTCRAMSEAALCRSVVGLQISRELCFLFHGSSLLKFLSLLLIPSQAQIRMLPPLTWKGSARGVSAAPIKIWVWVLKYSGWRPGEEKRNMKKLLWV